MLFVYSHTVMSIQDLHVYIVANLTIKVKLVYSLTVCLQQESLHASKHACMVAPIKPVAIYILIILVYTETIKYGNNSCSILFFNTSI